MTSNAMSPASRPQASPALQVRSLRKVYGAEAALADVSLDVLAGEIHGLLGANGAGKSTLIKIISGVEPQDAGHITVNGVELPAPHHAADVRAAGCAYIHQDRALVPALTVAENVALALAFPRRAGMIDTRATHMLAAEALGRVGLDVPTSSLVGELPIAEQTLVAIARALAADAALLLLDEPTANLGAADAQMVYERLRTLRSGGTACVLITHHLDEALDVCDRITVLRDGRHVATKRACELDPVELTRLMVGDQYMRSVEVPVASHTRARADTVLKVAGLAVIPGRGIDLDLHAGEILGVTGLPDSGHLDLGEVVFGARRAIGGSMELVGAAFEPGSTRDAIESGVAMVPGDRLRDGLSSTMTLRENLFLSPKSDHRLISATRERRHGAEILHRFGVKPPNPDAEVSTLSGGNMQKVLLAKWLIRRPRLLILCEPTVGVDVAARADIYRRLREAAEEGVAILLLSSDQDEVAELSDRAIVLRYGEVRARLEGENLTAEHLGAASQGWTGHSASKDPTKQR